MTYLEAVNYLLSINHMKLGLNDIQSLLKHLGNPEKNFKSIHIAGTNGKGSVSTKIATSLSKAGYKTGLFTSPHISTFRERIQINGALISEEDVVYYLQKTLSFDLKPTFFEASTVMAFLYFSEKQVDYAVIETGLGGRKDATNVLMPELSIITSIAKDHTEILGDTLEKIAHEKAGIIKAGVQVLIGPRVPFIKGIQVHGVFATYDAENTAIAKTALEVLKVPVNDGIFSRPPCRIEQVDNLPIILDVAHNPDGLTALFKSLKVLYPNMRFSALVGLSDSKDIDGCLEVLIQNVSHLFLVQAKIRGTPTKTLAEKLDHLKFSSYTEVSSVEDGMKLIQTPLLICGTFFIMNEARIALGLSYPSDPLELNERHGVRYNKM